MIINGTKYREIYPQQAINWSTAILLPYTTGNLTFGFSGENGNDDIFKLKNGKILSPNSELIGSYQQNQRLYFSGNIGNKTIDLYGNNIPLYLGLQRQSSGDIRSIQYNSEDNSFVNLENLTINGTIPNISYGYDPQSSGYLPYLIFKTGDSLTYPIINNGNYTLSIASGYSENENYVTSGLENLNILPNSSGNFYIKNMGYVDQFVEQIPINIFTNAGNLKFIVNALGQISQVDDYYIYLTSSDTQRVVNNGVSYYELLYYNATGVDISASLQYNSGITGSYYRSTAAVNYLSGYVFTGIYSGTGIVTQQISGQVSGYNNIISGYEYGSGSGMASGFVSGTGVPTLYTVTGSGYLQGNINTYIGERKFTGIWDLRTGQNDIYAFFRQNGFTSGEKYYSRISSPNLGGSISFLQVAVAYNNILNTISGEAIDTARLVINAINFGPSGSGISLELVGVR